MYLFGLGFDSTRRALKVCEVCELLDSCGRLAVDASVLLTTVGSCRPNTAKRLVTVQRSGTSRSKSRGAKPRKSSSSPAPRARRARTAAQNASSSDLLVDDHRDRAGAENAVFWLWPWGGYISSKDYDYEKSTQTPKLHQFLAWLTQSTPRFCPPPHAMIAPP